MPFVLSGPGGGFSIHLETTSVFSEGWKQRSCAAASARGTPVAAAAEGARRDTRSCHPSAAHQRHAAPLRKRGMTSVFTRRAGMGYAGLCGARSTRRAAPPRSPTPHRRDGASSRCPQPPPLPPPSPAPAARPPAALPPGVADPAGPVPAEGARPGPPRPGTFVVDAQVALREADVVVLVLGAPGARQRRLLLVDGRVEAAEAPAQLLLLGRPRSRRVPPVRAPRARLRHLGFALCHRAGSEARLRPPANGLRACPQWGRAARREAESDRPPPARHLLSLGLHIPAGPAREAPPPPPAHRPVGNASSPRRAERRHAALRTPAPRVPRGNAALRGCREAAAPLPVSAGRLRAGAGFGRPVGRTNGAIRTASLRSRPSRVAHLSPGLGRAAVGRLRAASGVRRRAGSYGGRPGVLRRPSPWQRA